VAVSDTPADYRKRLFAAIVDTLRDDEAIRAVGEGGAAARGRADGYSDLDLVVVAPLARADAVFARVEAAIAAVARITHRWCVEPPGFAGMAQRFYFLDKAPRFFAVDCSILSPEGVAPFTERERHGEAIVGFDRDGVLQPRAADTTLLARRRAQRLAQLQGALPVYSMLVTKELARGHALEAYGFYQVLLRALIELLGMQHRPDRFDFGWRYVDSELPAPAQALLARHAFVAGEEALAGLAESLSREIAALLAALAPGTGQSE
jgi:predicted nucleotidyltransferase